jgi:hypothetical protein
MRETFGNFDHVYLCFFGSLEPYLKFLPCDKNGLSVSAVRIGKKSFSSPPPISKRNFENKPGTTFVHLVFTAAYFYLTQDTNAEHLLIENST